MLSGEQAARPAPRQEPVMEGVGTEAQPPSGSITGRSLLDNGIPGSEGMAGPTMMEGSPLMIEGAAMMDGSGPDYEGAALPGEPSYGAPKAPDVAPPMPDAATRRRFDPGAMRSAVVWAEILGKPKSLRRVAR